MWSLGVMGRIISRYWGLISRNVDRLRWEGAERVLRREESRVLHKDLFSPLGMGAESEKRPQQMVCYRPADEPEGLDVGWRDR